MVSSNVLLLLVLLLFSVTEDAARYLPQDQSVFLNHTATFTFCTSLLPVSYIINGQRSDLLDNSLKVEIEFNYNGSCYSLCFPAWIDYDRASIRFHYNQTSNSRTATLHVQDTLGPPMNLHFVEVNSTHISLVWNSPPSLLGHENTSYEVVFKFQGADLINNSTTSSTNCTLLRPAVPVFVSVTVWNPVGRGETSTLNFTKSLRECQTMADVTPEVFPYFEDGSISAVINLLHINENSVYCFDDISLVHTWGGSVITTPHVPVIEKSTAVIKLHNLPKERHLHAALFIGSSLQHFINMSTYSVQSVTNSEDYIILKCKFLSGVSTTSCFVVVYHNNEFSYALSGSDTYTLNITEGNYTLKVYDDVGQRDRGVEPAQEISFDVTMGGDGSDEGPNELVIGIAVGTGLLCFALVVVVVVVVVVVWNVYDQHHQRGRQEVCQPQEDDPVSLPLCPRGYVLKREQGSAIETGIHLTRRTCQQPFPTSAVHRENGDGSKPFGEEVVEMPPGVGTFNTNGTVSIKSRSDEDAAALVLDDLKNTNLDTVLYQTPVDQNTIKTT